MNTKKQKNSFLPILTAVVVIVAAAIPLMPKTVQESISLAENGDVLVHAEAIGTEASYFDYDANGTTVPLFAVRASDGTVRLALNTCQVCNGSPYAYFVQEGDAFICQNCGNAFASTDVGILSGGCNPIPITDQVYRSQDGILTIPADFLIENAPLFRNWKNF